MKHLVISALLLAASGIANAQDQPTDDTKKHDYCYMKSHVYMQSAMARDNGGSPQSSWDYFSNQKQWDLIPRSELKSIINHVYLDRDFAYAGGEALFKQMYDLCMNGPKKWKPLK